MEKVILQWRKCLEIQSFRWGFVGIVTNSLDYLLFLVVFYRFDSIVIANFISTLTATFLNYSIHHNWTFKTNQTLVISGFKYFIVLFFWWVVSTTLIKILFELGLDPRISKIVPYLFIIPLNFFILKLYVFKRVD
jgi:putative flippase GtrA